MLKVRRLIELSVFVFVVLLTSYIAFFVPTMGLNAYFGYDCEIGPFRSYCYLNQNDVFAIEKYMILFCFICVTFLYFRKRFQNSTLIPLIYFLCLGFLFSIFVDIIVKRVPIYFSEILYYVYYSSIIVSAFSFIFIAIIMEVRIRHTLEYMVFFTVYVFVTNLALLFAYTLGQHYPGAVSLLLLFTVFAFGIFPVHLMGVARIAAIPARLVPQ